jgi:hypothetical protein
VARRETEEQEQHALGQIPTEKLIEELEAEILTSPLLAQLFGQKLDLQSVLEH